MVDSGSLAVEELRHLADRLSAHHSDRIRLAVLLTNPTVAEELRQQGLTDSWLEFADSLLKDVLRGEVSSIEDERRWTCRPALRHTSLLVKYFGQFTPTALDQWFDSLEASRLSELDLIWSGLHSAICTTEHWSFTQGGDISDRSPLTEREFRSLYVGEPASMEPYHFFLVSGDVRHAAAAMTRRRAKDWLDIDARHNEVIAAREQLKHELKIRGQNPYQILHVDPMWWSGQCITENERLVRKGLLIHGEISEEAQPLLSTYKREFVDEPQAECERRIEEWGIWPTSLACTRSALCYSIRDRGTYSLSTARRGT